MKRDVQNLKNKNKIRSFILLSLRTGHADNVEYDLVVLPSDAK